MESMQAFTLHHFNRKFLYAWCIRADMLINLGLDSRRKKLLRTLNAEGQFLTMHIQNISLLIRRWGRSFRTHVTGFVWKNGMEGERIEGSGFEHTPLSGCSLGRSMNVKLEYNKFRLGLPYN